MLNSVPVQKRSDLMLDKGNKEELLLSNITIWHAVGSHFSRRDLKSIQVACVS